MVDDWVCDIMEVPLKLKQGFGTQLKFGDKQWRALRQRMSFNAC